MIPKIIHYIWVGPRPFPEEDRARVEQWRRVLPDWEIRHWGNDDVDFSSRYLRQAYAVRAWNRVSDYTRMDALVKHGGIYLDTDIDILKPFDPLLDRGAFVGFQNTGEMPHELVNGAVFGARKSHWFPSALRDHFNRELDGRVNMYAFSGPGLLTQKLKERGLTQYSDDPVDFDDVTVFPRRFFYPYGWGETYSQDVVTPETYAVHHWAETWVSKPSLKSRIRRKILDKLAWHAPAAALNLSKYVARRGNPAKVRS